MRLLLRLYPPSWRERYGDEFEALLEEHPVGPRVALDALRGALDARLKGRICPGIARKQKEVTMVFQREELQEEVHAILAACQELGPEHEQQLVEGLLDRLEGAQKSGAPAQLAPMRRLRRGFAAFVIAGSAVAGGWAFQHRTSEEIPPVVMSCAPLPRCEQVYPTPLGYRLSAAKISRQGYWLVKRWGDSDGFIHAIWARKQG